MTEFSEMLFFSKNTSEKSYGPYIKKDVMKTNLYNPRINYFKSKLNLDNLKIS